MDFSAFDKTKLDEYAREAKKTWGDTLEYKEFEKKSKNRSDKDNQQFVERFIQSDKICIFINKLFELWKASLHRKSKSIRDLTECLR